MTADEERAKVVAYLRRPRTGMGYIGRYLANKIEALDHHKAP